MKKTLTANISGTVFHIEEDAYDALQRYLATIRSQFVGSPGQDEIMADIEARIAELFTERLEGRGQVVTIRDVDHIIGIMGQPEEYLGEEERAEEQRQSSGTFTGSQRKRLFRDTDDRWLGGVLGGLGAYINTDPLWLRIAFILLVVLGMGSPILIYLILWVLVPPATTAAERLMMEGEPVTVDNLKKAFEEGGKRVAKEVEDLGERWSGAEGKRYAQSVRSGARRAARGTSRALAAVIGFVLFMIGVSLGISLLGTAVGGTVFAFDGFDGSGGTTLTDLGQMVFPSSGQALWFAIAVFLVCLIPVIGLLTAGLQLMLGLRAPAWMAWVFTPLWVIALVVAIVISIRLGRDFRQAETIVHTVTMEHVDGQILHLRNLDTELSAQSWRLHLDNGAVDWDLEGLRTTVDSIHGGWGRLDVRRSPDADFHVRIERTTQGAHLKTSRRRSENIAYGMVHGDSTLAISPWLSFPKEDKLRAQRLRFVVLVPVGKAVHFDPDLEDMLDDVKNVTNTHDRDMVGRTWTMTSNGLSASVRPEDVPDDMFQPIPNAPQQPEPAEEQDAVRPTIREVGQELVLPDLVTVLRRTF